MVRVARVGRACPCYIKCLAVADCCYAQGHCSLEAASDMAYHAESVGVNQDPPEYGYTYDQRGGNHGHSDKT